MLRCAGFRSVRVARSHTVVNAWALYLAVHEQGLANQPHSVWCQVPGPVHGDEGFVEHRYPLLVWGRHIAQVRKGVDGPTVVACAVEASALWIFLLQMSRSEHLCMHTQTRSIAEQQRSPQLTVHTHVQALLRVRALALVHVPDVEGVQVQSATGCVIDERLMATGARDVVHVGSPIPAQSCSNRCNLDEPAMPRRDGCKLQARGLQRTSLRRCPPRRREDLLARTA